MEKMNVAQLELFSQDNNRACAANPNGKGSFFTFIRAYEKVILFIIAFAATGIVSFSLGVEKGKRLAESKPVTLRDYAAKTQPPLPVKPSAIPLPVEKEAVSQPTNQEKDLLQNYTIQVGSYQTKNQAQKEAQVLKKRGLFATVVSKGKYDIVCVGSFPSKTKAQTTLVQLKKQYRDCFIRKL